MEVVFTARGNFKPLAASLRGLNKQMHGSFAGMDNVVRQKAIHPINDLSKSLRAGRVDWQQAGRAIRNHGKFIREHNAIMNATPRIYRDAAGNAQVMLDVNRNLAKNAATLGQRFMFINSVMHGFGRNIIAVGKNMQWAGRQVMVGLTLPLGLLATAAVRAATEYDRQVTRIIKVNNDASAAALRSAEDFDMVAKSIRRQAEEITRFGASLGFLAADTSKLVAEFSQMGFAGRALDELSESALRLSRVSGTDLDSSIELTRLTAQAFGVELENLTATFAKLNLVENNTALSLDEMATAIPVVAGVAATMGLEIEEVAGLLAMMKENGISAKEGATALRTGLIRIVQEATDPAIEAFAGIGLNLVAMQERMQTLGDGDVMFFFDELGQHLSRLQSQGEGSQAALNDFTAAIGKLTGTRQAARFLTFLGEVPHRFEQGTVAQRAFIGATTDSAHAMEIFDFEQRQVDESAAGISDRLKSEMNFELVKLGENFLTIANAIRQFGVDALRWFNNLSDGVRNTVTSVGMFIAALGPVTMLLGIMANAFGQIITLITKFLPKMSLATFEQRAMEAAYFKSARAIDAQTAALGRNTGALAMNAAAARGGTATAMLPPPSAASRLAGPGLPAPVASTRLAGAAPAGMAAGKGLLGGASALAGPLAAVAAIAAAIAAIPILADPGAFFASFKQHAEGPLNRLKDAFSAVGDMVSRIVGLIRGAAGDSDGLSRISEIIGHIAGVLGGTIMDALANIVEIVTSVLGNGFEALFSWVNMIGHIISGDWTAALNSFGEFAKAIFRIFVDWMATMMNGWANMLEASARWIPGVESVVQRLRDGATAMQEWDAIQSSYNEKIAIAQAGLREGERAQRDVNKALAEANAIHDELLGKGWIMANQTEEQILNNENLTDEMKKQLIARLMLIEIEEELAELQVKLRNEMAKTGGGTLSLINSYIGRMKTLRENIGNIGKEAADKIEVATRNTAQWVDEHGDYNDALSTSNDLLKGLQKEQERLNELIRESERAAQAWANALQSGMGEVMGDILAAVRAAIAEQEEEMRASFENRMAEIDEKHDAELRAIDEIVKAEAEAERRRQQWFERERARIAYLERRTVGNLQLREALARGDVMEAAITRISLHKDAERFILDSNERIEKSEREKRAEEIQGLRDVVEEARRAAAEQLRIEEEAARLAMEARNRSIEQYLRDWQRVIPATEQEFNKHLSDLGVALNNLGISMTVVGDHYTRETGNLIVRGFTSAIDIATKTIAEAKKWEAAGLASGAQYRKGLMAELAKIEKDIENAMGGSGTSNFSPPPSPTPSTNREPTVSYTGPRLLQPGEVPIVGVQYAMHSGGGVKPNDAMPGLRPDEGQYILQAGEYVVQKDAVDALGRDYFERLNRIKHDGGLVDFSKGSISEGKGFARASGFAAGLHGNTLAASVLAENGVEPKFTSEFGYKTSGQDFGKRVGAQINEAIEAFLFISRAGEAGPQSDSGSGWPPRSLRTLASNTAQALRFINSNNWGSNVSAFAGLSRADTNSDHAWGKAIDAMVARLGTYPDAKGHAAGWRIANWFLANAGAFGTKYVVWDGLIKNPRESSWRPYTRYGANPGPTLGHYDHPHISFMHEGGMVNLRKGGKIKMDNVVANLHKGETVLTAPITKNLEEAIRSMAGGGGQTVYKLEFNIDGGNIDEEKLAALTIKKIEMLDRSKGRTRVVK